MAFSIMLYALIGVVFLLLSLGGIGAAIVGVQFGRGEDIARLTLGGLFTNGVVLSLLLGVGPRAAFSDSALRRYPLKPTARLLVRHFLALLDPLWPLLLAVALGIAAGFAALGVGSIFLGVPAALLFIISNYLATVALLSIVDRLLEYRAGATVLSVVGLALVSLSGFVVPLVAEPSNQGWVDGLGSLLRYTPPGLAASLLNGPAPQVALFDLLALAGWSCAFVMILVGLERRPARARASRSSKLSWETPYDLVAGLFGKSYGPLVAKSLRYHLRCNRVRFNLAITPLMLGAIGNMFLRDGSAENSFILTIAVFFYGGIVSTGAVTLNHFGYDDAGIRRYAVLPITFEYSLRAASFASLLIGGMALPPGLLLWALINRVSYEPVMAVVLLLSGVAGLFFFNALSLWSSVLSPKRVDFNSIVGNQLSVGGNLVLIGGTGVAFGLAFFIMQRSGFEKIMNYWWVFLVMAAGCAGFYRVSLGLVTGVLRSRRERLIEVIAGGSRN